MARTLPPAVIHWYPASNTKKAQAAAAMAAPAVISWVNRLTMGPVSMAGKDLQRRGEREGRTDDRPPRDACLAPGTSASGARTRRLDGASLRGGPSLGRPLAVPGAFRNGPTGAFR